MISLAMHLFSRECCQFFSGINVIIITPVSLNQKLFRIPCKHLLPVCFAQRAHDQRTLFLPADFYQFIDHFSAVTCPDRIGIHHHSLLLKTNDCTPIFFCNFNMIHFPPDKIIGKRVLACISVIFLKSGIHPCLII